MVATSSLLVQVGNGTLPPTPNPKGEEEERGGGGGGKEDITYCFGNQEDGLTSTLWDLDSKV